MPLCGINWWPEYDKRNECEHVKILGHAEIDAKNERTFDGKGGCQRL